MESVPLVLTLYSAPDCCLCQVLHDQIVRLEAEFPLRLELVDISADPLQEQEFRAEIPVLMINGRKAVKFRISTAALRDKLRRASGRGSGMLRLFR